MLGTNPPRTRILHPRLPPSEQRRARGRLPQRHQLHLPPLQHRRARHPRTHRLGRPGLPRRVPGILQPLRTPRRPPDPHLIGRHFPLPAARGQRHQGRGPERGPAALRLLGRECHGPEAGRRGQRDGLQEPAADFAPGAECYVERDREIEYSSWYGGCVSGGEQLKEEED